MEMENMLFSTHSSPLNAKNRLLALWNFKIFWGSMPPDTPGKSGLPTPCTYGHLLYLNLLTTSIFIETPALYMLACRLSGKINCQKINYVLL